MGVVYEKYFWSHFLWFRKRFEIAENFPVAHIHSFIACNANVIASRLTHSLMLSLFMYVCDCVYVFYY